MKEKQKTILGKLYVKNWTTYKKMDKFLEIHNLPKLNQQDIENLNTLIVSNKIQSAIKKKTKPPNKHKSRTMWIHK